MSIQTERSDFYEGLEASRKDIIYLKETYDLVLKAEELEALEELIDILNTLVF